MEQQKRRKSTRVVIISLAVALAFALGWIVWQNFIFKEGTKKDVDLVVVDKKKEQAKKPLALKHYCLAQENLCFDYPETWSFKETKTEHTRVENGAKTMFTTPGVKLTSEDKKVALVLSTGIGNLGGTCQPGERGSIYVVDTKAINDSFYAISLVSEHRSGRYVPTVGLYSAKKQLPKGKQDGCSNYMAELITMKQSLPDYRNLMSFTTNDGHDDTSEEAHAPSVAKSLDDAKRQLGSATYRQAFDIAKSAHYK